MSSSAERARVPEPALNTVPFAMVKAPPELLLSRSLSALMLMFPVVVVKSPAAVKIISSFARRPIEPPADTAPFTFKELFAPTVIAIFPPTVEVERVTALSLTSVALPEVPKVFKFNMPVKVLDVLSRVIT